MKLNTLEIARLLPSFIRDDENFKAIIYAIEPEFKNLYRYTELIKLYQNLDSLPEVILDELAVQFSISEYNTSYDISVKRNLIRNCLGVHRKRGTVAAVIEVCEKIFGDATIEEWFDYGGEPYHFKVYTESTNISESMISEFKRVVNETKNARSHLDELVVTTMNSVDVTFGFALYMSDDTTLSTEDYESPEPLIEIEGGELIYNDTGNTLSVAFYDVDTKEVYLLKYNSELDGLILDKIEDTTGIAVVDIMWLTDTMTGEEYKVFVQDGKLYYEKTITSILGKGKLGEMILE